MCSFADFKGDLPYPIIADPGRDLAVKFGMIDPDEKDEGGMPLTCRAVRNNFSDLFFIQKEKDWV